MKNLKNLSMADLLALGNYADKNMEFAQSFGDEIEQDIYDKMSNLVHLEIEARVKKLFPTIKGL